MFESEHLLKVFYAENGSTADVLAMLHGLREWVHRLTVQNVEVGASYGPGRAVPGAAPDPRAHQAVPG